MHTIKNRHKINYDPNIIPTDIPPEGIYPLTTENTKWCRCGFSLGGCDIAKWAISYGPGKGIVYACSRHMEDAQQ